VVAVKMAIAGKGGVGKTLIAGTLSRILARDGYEVLAVDADPAMNLSYALGVSSEVASTIVPIAENKGLIEERVGTGFGPLIKLNPAVDDIVADYGVEGPDGVKLLVMGTVRSGGSGCMCPANALVRALIRHLTLKERSIVVVDMEAGLEHLGRATVRGFDLLVCVVEPGAQSIETAKKIWRLAKDIGIKDVMIVGNKVTESEDIDFFEESLGEIGLKPMYTIPFDPKLLRADARGVAPIDFSSTSPAVKAIDELARALEGRYG
jgi:CO dehydrogenase maturation factor